MSDAADVQATETTPEVPEAPAAEGAEGGAREKKGRQRRGCLSRITPVSTPGCASCLTAVFLVTTAVTLWLIFFLDPANIPWRYSMSIFRIGGVVLLIALIPWALNKTLRLWLEGEPSPFPDLEYAWRAGLQALASNGIAIDSVPIYILLGSASEQQERALLEAAGLKMRVTGVPEGPAPLHWYANPDGIYLFCSDASWTSALASLREELAEEAAAKGQAAASAGLPPLVVGETGAAIQESWVPPPTAAPIPVTPAPPPAAAPAPASKTPGRDSTSGTILVDQYLADQQLSADYLRPAVPVPVAPAPPPAPPSPPAGEGDRGTMTLQQPIQLPAAETSAAPLRAVATAPSEPFPTGRDPVVVAPQYSSACLQELNYLGQLLRRARQPVCGCNGVLMLLPVESIHSTPVELEELQKAIRADLATLQYSLQVRAPVTALVVGLEKERGFRELVRRVGRDRAAGQRFGRKFDVRAVPYVEDMTALSAHVCGAFEDWAYTLFREEESLTRPGNTRLYELLSKVRCSWKSRLAEILAGGFGLERGKHAPAESLLFSGCYLAATGETADRQAFAKGVFDKLREEQEMVEWSEEALAANRWQGHLAVAGMAASTALLVTLVSLAIYNNLRE